MPKYVKRTRRPLKATRRPRKRTGKGYVTKTQVKNMFNRRVENKCASRGIQGDTISNALSSAALLPYFYQLNYVMPQGLGQGARIGNRVHHKSASLKGSIHFRDVNALNNSRQLSQLVKVIVFKVKNYQTGLNPTNTNFFSQMFQFGSSTAGIQNLPIDMIRKLNTDIMQVKAIRNFKMGFSSVQAGTTAGAGVGTSPVPNNDFKYQQFFNINLTKCYKKNQQWNDVEQDAHNDNLFFMILTCPADGSQFTSTPLSIDWDLEQIYEDA